MKKLVCILVSVVMSTICFLNVFATTPENTLIYINPNTLITQDNIIEVMNYLKLDVNKLILVPQEKGYSSLTVGELQKKIEEAKIQDVKIKSTTEYLQSNYTLAKASTIHTKMLYRTADMGSFKITYSVGIKYELCNAGIHIWELFQDITSMNASVVADTGIYAITKKSFDGSIENEGKRAKVISRIEVTSYLNMLFGKIPINTTPINSTNYYYAQTIN